MSKIVFIKENSPEVRQKLKDVGFGICVCAEFVDSVWLDYHPEDKHLYKDIHGTGYTDETDGEEMNRLSPEERIKLWLSLDCYYSKDREFFDTVEEFLEKYPKPKNKI